MVLWAVCIGTPMSSTFYDWLDKFVKIQGPLGVALKLFIDQTIYAAWYYMLYLFFLKMLETQKIKLALKSIKD